MEENDWFKAHSIDRSSADWSWDKPSSSMLFDALVAGLLGWAFMMAALATIIRALLRR